MQSIIGLSSDYNLHKFYRILFIISAALAFYHTGVERGWFEMSAVCKPLVSINHINSAESFKNMLYSGKMGLCNKPVFTIMGYSMAEMNLVLNIVLLFSSFFYKEEKNA